MQPRSWSPENNRIIERHFDDLLSHFPPHTFGSKSILVGGYHHYVVVQPIVHLADLQHEINKSRYVEVYADVVFLSKGDLPVYFQGINKTAIIVCREIRLYPESRFTGIALNPDQGARVIVSVFADRPVKAPFRNDCKHFNLYLLDKVITNKNIGVKLVAKEVHVPDEFFSLTSLPEISTVWMKEHPLLWILRISYAVAFRCLQPNPEIALEMSQWALRLMGNNASFSGVRSSWRFLFTRAMDYSRGINVVPYLSESVYQDATKQLLEVVNSFEEKYYIYADRKANAADRLASVNKMLQNASATQTFRTTVADMAKNALHRAESKEQRGKQLLAQQKHVVGQEQQKFSDAVEEYRTGSFEKALWEGFKAGLTFGIAIASIGEGNPSGIGAAVSEVQALAKTESRLEKLFDVVERISKILEAVSQMMQTLKSIEQSLSSADALRKTEELPHPPRVLMDSEWQTFGLDVEEMLRPAKGVISGAEKYETELKKMVVYGRSYLALYTSLVNAKEEVSRQRLAMENQQKITSQIATLKTTFTHEVQDDAQMQMSLLNVMMDLKALILILITEQVDSYKYWALDVNVRFSTGSISDETAQLKRVLWNVKARKIAALTSFNPRPQPFTGIEVHLEDEPGFLESLHTTKEATVVIGLNSKPFINFARVRVTGVEVRFNKEALVNEDEAYYVTITTNGVYQDRKHLRELFTFSGPASTIGYGAKRGVTTFGGGERDKNAVDYFEPTVFCGWGLNFGALNSNVNVERIQKISMVFSGEAVIMRS